MHSTPRTTLLGTLLTIGMSASRLRELPKVVADAFREGHAPIPPKGRARLPRGGRVRRPKERLFCKAAAHKPVKYTQASPKTVTGVRLRWQEGQLVPRDTVQALPLRKRQAERLITRMAKQRREEGHAKPQRPVKHGGNRRGDMKGAMRAARRAGIITARQQRLIHRGIRAGGYAPETLLKMLALEDRRNPEVVA